MTVAHVRHAGHFGVKRVAWLEDGVIVVAPHAPAYHPSCAGSRGCFGGEMEGNTRDGEQKSNASPG